MAIQSTVYVLDGTTNKFSSTKHIGSKQHLAVWLKEVAPPNNLVQVDIAQYELINNFAVMLGIPDDTIYSQLEVRVADTPDELGASQSDIVILVGIKDEIVAVANVADDVPVVAAIDDEIVAVSLNEANINPVGEDLLKGKGTNQPTDSSILNALDNASIAITKAAESSASASASATSAANALASEQSAAAIVVDPLVNAITNIDQNVVHFDSQTAMNWIKGVGGVSFERVQTTDGSTSADNRYGEVEYYNNDAPRFGKKGMLIEPLAINIYPFPDIGTTQVITVLNATTYTMYFRDGAGSITLSGATTGAIIGGKDNSVTFTTTSTTLTCTVSGQADKVQLELGSIPTSYIPNNTASPVQRNADLIAINHKNMPRANDLSVIIDFLLNGLTDTTNHLWGHYTGGNYILCRILNDGRIEFKALNGINTLSLTSNNTLVKGNEYVVNCTISNGVAYIYINGVLDNSTPIIGGDVYTNHSEDITIGRLSPSIDGTMCHIQLKSFKINKALTPTESRL